VGCPIAAVIRRTCRFRPSVSLTPIHTSGTLGRTRIGGTRGPYTGCGDKISARQGSVFFP